MCRTRLLSHVSEGVAGPNNLDDLIMSATMQAACADSISLKPIAAADVSKQIVTVVLLLQAAICSCDSIASNTAETLWLAFLSCLLLCCFVLAETLMKQQQKEQQHAATYRSTTRHVCLQASLQLRCSGYKAWCGNGSTNCGAAAASGAY
jgi:hypothetical protein